MKAFVLLIALTFSGTSMAASQTTTRTKVTMDEAKKALKGFSLVGFFSFTDRIPMKTDIGRVTAKTNNAFGMGMEYKTSIQNKANPLPLSVVGGLMYESPRELRNISVQGATAFPIGATPKFSLFNFYANLKYETQKQFSLFAGINYPVTQTSNFDGMKLMPSPGGQMGITMNVAKEFSADMTYRWLNLRGNNGVSRLDVDGLMVQGRYIF